MEIFRSGCARRLPQCRGNPFDAIELDKAALLTAAEGVLGVKAAKRRGAFLLDHTALLDDDVEPLEVLAGGRLGPATVAALTVLGAPRSEFKSWNNAVDAFPWLRDGAGADEAPSWVAEGSLGVADAPSSELTPDMAGVLRAALEARLGRYACPDVESDEAALAELCRGPGSEGGAARTSAVTLRLEEKRLIRQLLDTLAAAPQAHSLEGEAPASPPVVVGSKRGNSQLE